MLAQAGARLERVEFDLDTNDSWIRDYGPSS
jgi:agmatine/peptidylarginine deiminase